MYGHRSDPGSPVEVVAARLIGRVCATDGFEPGDSTFDSNPEHLRRADRGNAPSVDGGDSRSRTRVATFDEPWGAIDTPVVTRRMLASPMHGPVLIDEYDATIVVPPDMSVLRDDSGNVVMEFRQ